MGSVQSNNDTGNILQYIADIKPTIEEALEKFLPTSADGLSRSLDEAIRNTVFSERRFLAATLAILSAEIMGGKIETALPASAAVEFIGASARAFFGENETTNASGALGDTNVAILCGIALLNSAYDLVFVEHNVLPERAMRAHAEIVECVGTSQIFGSVRSTSSAEDAEISNSDSSTEREAALIRLAVRLGAVLSGANYLELDALSRFAGRFSDALATKKVLTAGQEQGNVSAAMSHIRVKDSADQAKLVLIENFPSSEARSHLIQLVDEYTGV